MKKPKTYKPKRGTGKKFNLKNKERSYRQSLYQTKRWKSFRFKFLHYNNKCFCCNEKSEVVDHCKVHKGDEAIFFDELNMLPMCKPCHDYVTGKFDKHKVQDLVGKMKWIQTMRKERNITSSIKVVRFQ